MRISIARFVISFETSIETAVSAIWYYDANVIIGRYLTIPLGEIFVSVSFEVYTENLKGEIDDNRPKSFAVWIPNGYHDKKNHSFSSIAASMEIGGSPSNRFKQ